MSALFLIVILAVAERCAGKRYTEESSSRSFSSEVIIHHNLSVETEAETDQCSAINEVKDITTNTSWFLQSNSEALCHKCAAKGCKWCPLDQKCAGHTGCTYRVPSSGNKYHEDAKVRNAKLCKQAKVPWMMVMDKMYGKAWRGSGLGIAGELSKLKLKYGDALGCIQWLMGEQGTSVTENSGMWGCASVMLREGFKAVISEKYPSTKRLSISVLEKESTQMNRGEESMNVTDGTGSKEHWSAFKWAPAICSLINVFAESKRSMSQRINVFSSFKACEIWALGPYDFSNLLDVQSVGYSRLGGKNALREDLLESLQSGPILSFSPGAGKSGSGFAQTFDKKFKIKVGLKQGATMKEARNLMHMMKGEKPSKPSLAEHLEKHPGSLLNRYYGMLKISLPFWSSPQYVLLMADAAYGVSDRADKWLKRGVEGLSVTRYDLKGESRNQDKLQDDDHAFTLLNGDFKQREYNHMFLTDMGCTNFREVVAADTAWLEKYEMVDYSLLMTLATKPETVSIIPKNFIRDPGTWQHDLGCQTAGAPKCFETPRYTYSLSIIDYLNNYNWWKKGESMFSGKMWYYGDKFMRFINKICPTTEETKAFKGGVEKVNRAFVKKFGTLENAFKAIDKSGDGIISEEEFKDWLRSLNGEFKLKEEEITKLVNTVDLNDDNVIGMKEFLSTFSTQYIIMGEDKKLVPVEQMTEVS